MARFITLIFFSFLFIFILSLIGLRPIHIMILTFILLLISLYLPTLYYVYFSRDVDKINQFLLKRQHSPSFKLLYSLANNDDIGIEEALDTLIHRQNKQNTAIYETLYYVYKKDFSRAEQTVKQINHKLYRTYYEVLIIIHTGDKNDAHAAIESVPNGWMKDALYTEWYQSHNEPLKAREHAQAALHKVKGLNYYLLYKTYVKEGLYAL
ncbi:hypothetical protein LGQ02_20475 [Bacillus shivajii]|uniref:hypothetical protein n=1 Tax=Bacillus shivajii TaxID=1983719 RepID=UPI001CFA32D1|nr:hypothetical protein [Bacillus shivajii]UCZ53120.1 hypothetical protein LGQ02_20475 [Bacillus shivajii]